jgi:hypothetical protein
MTIAFSTVTIDNTSKPIMTITNKNSGVAIRCLIFSTGSTWSLYTNTSYTTSGKRTDVTAAWPGDLIYPNNLTNSRHS